jgi:hypothetical protein
LGKYRKRSDGWEELRVFGKGTMLMMEVVVMEVVAVFEKLGKERVEGWVEGMGGEGREGEGEPYYGYHSSSLT